MSFKDKIYQNYVSFHNEHLYGRPTISLFESKFKANSYYLRRHLPDSTDVQILDIGCGDGNLVYWLQKIGYINACGVDVSQEQISYGKSLGVENLFQENLSEFVSTRTDHYSVIIARDVFEHFTKDDFLDTLILIRKSLKADGKLLIQVPNGEGINVGGILFGDVTHEAAYTVSSLRQMAFSANFGRIEVFPVNPKSWGLIGLLRSLLWQLKVWNVKFWRLIEKGNPGGPVTSNLLAVLYVS